MKILNLLLIATVILTLGILGFAYSGFYNVSAVTPHSGVVDWILTTTSRASIQRSAKDIVVPDLSDILLAKAGAKDYAAMCAGCHGAPGQKPEAVGLGLNPPPPDLAKVAAQSTPAELFWVTKYGIKMTGMPAWGATHEDQSIWPVVAFLTQLTTLDAEAYQAFLASAAGKGHHADQANHGEHAHDAPSNDRLGMHEGGKMDSQPLTENQATAERGHSDDGHDHEH